MRVASDLDEVKSRFSAARDRAAGLVAVGWPGFLPEPMLRGKQLTVAELIALLNAYDPALPVYVEGRGGEWTDCLTADEIRVECPEHVRVDSVHGKATAVTITEPEGLVIAGPRP